jgi:hypothetical protein
MSSEATTNLHCSSSELAAIAACIVYWTPWPAGGGASRLDDASSPPPSSVGAPESVPPPGEAPPEEEEQAASSRHESKGKKGRVVMKCLRETVDVRSR